MWGFRTECFKIVRSQLFPLYLIRRARRDTKYKTDSDYYIHVKKIFALEPLIGICNSVAKVWLYTQNFVFMSSMYLCVLMNKRAMMNSVQHLVPFTFINTHRGFRSIVL